MILKKYGKKNKKILFDFIKIIEKKIKDMDEYYQRTGLEGIEDINEVISKIDSEITSLKNLSRDPELLARASLTMYSGEAWERMKKDPSETMKALSLIYKNTRENNTRKNNMGEKNKSKRAWWKKGWNAITCKGKGNCVTEPRSKNNTRRRNTNNELYRI